MPLTCYQALSAADFDFCKEHRVGYVSLLPGTCYIELARSLIGEEHGNVPFSLGEVAFESIIYLDDVVNAPTIRVKLEQAAWSGLKSPSRWEWN